MQGHLRTPASAARPTLVVGRHRQPAAVGEDVGQLLYIVAGYRDFAALVLAAQPVDQLRAEDVDLPVQDAPL